MRVYQLYLVKEEFAAQYFGKEIKFYRLFKEYADSQGEQKEILLKQINFIIEPISENELRTYIKKYFHENTHFYQQDGCYLIKDGNRSGAKLEIFPKHLVLKAKGNYYAETVFFEALRKFEHSFLAVDLDNQNFGWLRPIKTRKFV